MDARKYWTQCRLHDWHYAMSDDPGVYRDGVEAEQALIEMAKQSPAHAEIYDAWRAYHFEAGAKPAEPNKMEDAQ